MTTPIALIQTLVSSMPNTHEITKVNKVWFCRIMEDIRGSVRDHPFMSRKKEPQFNNAEMENMGRWSRGRKVPCVAMHVAATQKEMMTRDQNSIPMSLSSA